MALSRPRHLNGEKDYERLKLQKEHIKGKVRILVLMKQATFYKGKLTPSPSPTWFKHAFNAFFNIITFILKLNTQGSVLLSHSMLLSFRSL